MAGAATTKIEMTITGLGDEANVSNESTLTVPVEFQKGYTVVATATTTAIQLFDMVDHIALNKIYGVYIECVLGTIYVKADTTGTTSITSSTAVHVFNLGEGSYIPLNPDNNAGLVVDAASVTDSFTWVIFGKA